MGSPTFFVGVLQSRLNKSVRLQIGPSYGAKGACDQLFRSEIYEK